MASRTYALKRLEQRKNKGKKLNYDILNGVGDQVYSGISDQNKLSNLAVEETFGEVAVYKNFLIHAFYHSTCGGRTEFGKNVFSSADVPYLQGVADNFGQDDFCKDSPYHRWIESFSSDEMSTDSLVSAACPIGPFPISIEKSGFSMGSTSAPYPTAIVRSLPEGLYRRTWT